MAIDEDEWDEIEALDEQWRRTFGESVPMGFEVTPDAAPMLRKCLRLKSRKPLQAYVALKLADGRIY